MDTADLVALLESRGIMLAVAGDRSWRNVVPEGTERVAADAGGRYNVQVMQSTLSRFGTTSRSPA